MTSANLEDRTRVLILRACCRCSRVTRLSGDDRRVRRAVSPNLVDQFSGRLVNNYLRVYSQCRPRRVIDRLSSAMDWSLVPNARVIGPWCYNIFPFLPAKDTLKKGSKMWSQRYKHLKDCFVTFKSKLKRTVFRLQLWLVRFLGSADWLENLFRYGEERLLTEVCLYQ